MNPEAQRIAIAEACGVKPRSRGWSLYSESENAVCLTGQTLAHAERFLSERSPDSWIVTKGYKPREDFEYPDYLNDLNAMAEAERVGKLGLDRCDTYGELLDEIVRRDFSERKPDARVCELYHWHASAAQRAEAFLKTIGKWEDGK